MPDCPASGQASIRMIKPYNDVTGAVLICICICTKCWNAGLSGIWSVQYQNEKTNIAGTSPVPD